MSLKNILIAVFVAVCVGGSAWLLLIGQEVSSPRPSEIEISSESEMTGEIDELITGEIEETEEPDETEELEKTENENPDLAGDPQEKDEPDVLNKDKIKKEEYSISNDQFRNLTIGFARKAAENYFDGQPTQHPKELEIEGDWEPYITIYYQGEAKSSGQGKNEELVLALKEAVENALMDKECENLTKEDLEDVRFLVKFPLTRNQFSFIEHNGEGKELVGDLTIVRDLDKELIYQKIEAGKEFLYKVMHKDEYGFYKKYDVKNDYFENRLHTVYSASIIYTFLYIYDLEKDEEILKNIADWGDFLLSMQNKDKKDKRHGAFHYSYYFNSQEKEKKFVVGTSALSIFTLLRLHDLTDDSKYLESATLAGDWLITMQETDGGMKPYVRYSDGAWVCGKKESLLYNGQVLSSLSKLYKTTGDKKYYDTAKRIADRFADKYEKEKGYIQGEYRDKNPISNSWAVMSLMDFYKVDQDDRYKNVIFELSAIVLENQKNDPNDLLHYGGWSGSYSSSGVGWMSEVMTETYRFCEEQGREDCGKYKDSVVKAIRWLIQSTYSEENTFFLKNPEKAIGGVFWSRLNKYVRTDSVCHALNGYVLMAEHLEDGLLLSIPEKPFEIILNKTKE